MEKKEKELKGLKELLDESDSDEEEAKPPAGKGKQYDELSASEDEGEEEGMKAAAPAGLVGREKIHRLFGPKLLEALACPTPQQAPRVMPELDRFKQELFGSKAGRGAGCRFGTPVKGSGAAALAGLRGLGKTPKGGAAAPSPSLGEMRWRWSGTLASKG